MPRSKTTRLHAAAAAALLTLTLAAPAFADDGWHDDDRGGRRGYPVHRHDRSCDHDDWRHDRGHHDGWRDHRWNRGHGYGRGDYGRHERYEHEYTCRPCRRGWSSRHSFHRHLAHEHHIPFWQFPRVVVETGWGWVFFG